MSKSRAYCFTINNPTEDDHALLMQLKDIAQYLIFGKEVGESGTPHYQGYVYYKNAVHFSSVKRKLPRAHIEIARGSPSANIKYCAKDGDVCEFGEAPKQGARKDIDMIRQDLEAGANMRAITMSATSSQSIKMAETYLKYHEEERNFKPIVKWYYGPTGSGKTYKAYEWLGHEDTYTCFDTAKWFDGYDKHENVLIDDFREEFASLKVMLRLLDQYPYKVETKGGSRQFLARKIAITCPYSPTEVYRNTNEDLRQLVRRIDEIIYVDGLPVTASKMSYLPVTSYQ